MTDLELRLTRAILAIEGLALEFVGDMSVCDDIYAIAHQAHGYCCRGGDDDEFSNRLEETIKGLKEAGIIDVDKEITKDRVY